MPAASLCPQRIPWTPAPTAELSAERWRPSAPSDQVFVGPVAVSHNGPGDGGGHKPLLLIVGGIGDKPFLGGKKIEGGVDIKGGHVRQCGQEVTVCLFLLLISYPALWQALPGRKYSTAATAATPPPWGPICCYGLSVHSLPAHGRCCWARRRPGTGP